MARDRDGELSAQEVAGHTRLNRKSVLCHRNTLGIPCGQKQCSNKKHTGRTGDFPLGNPFLLKEDNHEWNET